MAEPGDARPVRVRFAPAPSGDLHVGNVRTALYNWAYARRTGGTFVFRVEDTDRSRATDEAYHAALDILRWLGLDWDEGPEVGGPHGPYRQSERLEVYAGVLAQLQEQGAAYPCWCTQEEVAARTRAAGRPPGYDGHCRALSAAQVAAYRAEGRRAVLRFRMPDGETVVDDLVRGTVRWDNAEVPDFVLVRADGHPLYTLAATTDDVLMGLTHILRGEDLLPSVPRQMAMYAALGVARADVPRFGHLPMITGGDGQKLSKRHGETSINVYRREGFLPEALTNYLALLGWSMGEDRELFSLGELAEHFDVRRISRNPARFDVRKLEALNGDWLRRLTPGDLRGRAVPVLVAARVLHDPPVAEEEAVLDAVLPLAQTRMRRLTDVVALLAPLLVEEVVADPADVARTLIPEARAGLVAVIDALAAVPQWTFAAVEAAIRAALDGAGLKTKAGFPPVYVALTGRRGGLPLFDLVATLGRERTLGRLRAAVEAVGVPTAE